MPPRYFHQVAAPVQGLNMEHPATLISPGECPNCRNVRFRSGEIFKRVGYTTLTSTSGVNSIYTSLSGTPLFIDTFEELSGTKTALLATTNRVYKWTGTTWEEIKIGLSGAYGSWSSAAIMNDVWLYTNGVDAVQKWTGTGNMADLSGAADYGETEHRCRAVATFADRILLLGTWEGGDEVSQRVRWGEFGKLEEFNESEGGGYADLTDDPSGIYGAELLGNVLVIYCGHSIWQCVYIGGSVVYHFSRLVPNTGCQAPRTIAGSGFEHFFMGEDDIYRFGGQQPIPIGKRIRDDLFRKVSRDNRMNAFAAINRSDNEYRLYVPLGNTAGDITRAYIYNYQQDTWSMDDVKNMTTAAPVELGASAIIDDMDYGDSTIDGLPAEPIDNLGGYAGKQYWLYADDDGYVYQEDGREPNDAGAAIDSYWESKDFYGADDLYVNYLKRWEAIPFEARGDELTVSYSTDLGETWTDALTQTLSNGHVRYVAEIDVSSRSIRARFRNKSLNERFWLRFFAFQGYVASDR